MSKLTLSDITSGYLSIATVNANWALIEAALENTLSRDGTSPNTMGASLDMNSQRIINLASPQNGSDAARFQDIADVVDVTAIAPSMVGNSGKVLTTNGSIASWATLATLLGTELSAVADRLPYFTSASALSLATFTSYGRSIVAVADEAAFKALVNLEIGVDVQAFDADIAKLDVEDQVLTGGVRVTSKDLGTVSSGTLTPDPGDRPMQHYINGGAHTLAPGAVVGSYLLDITNNASAGTITTSGFTWVAGDAFTTTNGHKFRCSVSIGNAGSLLSVQKLQA